MIRSWWWVAASLAGLSGSFTASADFSQCPHHFPEGRSIQVDTQGRPSLKFREICFQGFAVLHSGVTKTPLVVVERLNQARLRDAADETRTDEFYEEARLPLAERASLTDYRGSGYDRGHMAPAADMATPSEMAQSFSLANIVAQGPQHNRKLWSKIEGDTRKYVRRARGDVFVFTGPWFQSQRTIGAGVWVPDVIWKVVYHPDANRIWAHWSPNREDAQIGRPISYAEFVRLTGGMYELISPEKAAQMR